MRRGRPLRLLTKRRLALGVALSAAVLVPLGAVGAASDWWFLKDGGAPKPLSAPLVVKEGEWSGHPWQLIAYRSSTAGLCVSITPKGSSGDGTGGAMACGPQVGVPRTAETTASDLSITFLSGAAGNELPAYIIGPVSGNAAEVELRFGTGEVLRVPTFGAPASLGDVRFYATQLPASVSAPLPHLGTATGRRFIDELAGFDSDGNVVACLVPQTAVNGVSPLSDCR